MKYRETDQLFPKNKKTGDATHCTKISICLQLQMRVCLEEVKYNPWYWNAFNLDENLLLNYDETRSTCWLNYAINHTDSMCAHCMSIHERNCASLRHRLLGCLVVCVYVLCWARLDCVCFGTSFLVNIEMSIMSKTEANAPNEKNVCDRRWIDYDHWTRLHFCHRIWDSENDFFLKNVPCIAFVHGVSIDFGYVVSSPTNHYPLM